VTEESPPDNNVKLDPQFDAQARAAAERWPIIIIPDSNGSKIIFFGAK
jgi:hypothetical protein